MEDIHRGLWRTDSVAWPAPKLLYCAESGMGLLSIFRFQLALKLRHFRDSPSRFGYNFRPLAVDPVHLLAGSLYFFLNFLQSIEPSAHYFMDCELCLQRVSSAFPLHDT